MSSGLRMTGSRGQRWLDGFAVTASVLCLIHCLILPALLLALPVLVTMLTVPESVHPVAFALALLTSALAIASGDRHHGVRWPVFVAGPGLTLLGVGALAIEMEEVERAVSSAGAVLLALSHGAGTRLACPVEDAA